VSNSALVLLKELGGLGIQLAVDGGNLRHRPVAAVTPELRVRIAACKPDLIALLRAEEQPCGACVPVPPPNLGDGERPNGHLCPVCRERDFVRPRAGGAWRCARCRPYDLAATEIEWWPRVGLTAPFDAHASALCCACGATARWRLRSGGPWVCRRCHPPLVPAGAIEVVGEVVS